MTIQELNLELGNIDLYLLDHLLKNRFSLNSKILDAGCGDGRNLIYFLNNGYRVYGVDADPDAIRMLKFISNSKYPDYDATRFNVGNVEDMDFESESFDLVISSAVLHFAESHEHFDFMFNEMVRVLKGQLFVRMTSDIGLQDYKPLETGRCALRDGTERYLITETKINELLQIHKLELIEPMKTVLVENKRSMVSLLFNKK